MKKIPFLSFLSLLIFSKIVAQNGTANAPIQATVSINSRAGHPMTVGSSGFNVRIGDKVWSYKHPDFIKAVNELRPGWLRYWSGTAGDAFCAATGQYDREYISVFDKGEAYDRLYEFVEVKGPHRLIDLYHLMGTIGGKVVVTVNAFTETPEMTAELARFCKNNHIQVEAWQFCNEPYFYIPARQRFWWNDGYDYAQKMKPHADSILQVFPDARLALNFTWDGIWTFMKEINRYQKEQGAFWNTFSKHSYAPHVGFDEPFDEAYKRLNTKVLEATNRQAMQDIEDWTQPKIPMLITEFGVWNRPLNGAMSAVYNAEYTLRQLAHPNTWLIGSHEISNKIKPAKNLNPRITDAFAKGEKLNTLALETGIEWDDEGKAFKILHEATNNSDYIFETILRGGAEVAGMKNTTVEGLFALAFRGTDYQDFVALTNRSDKWHSISLEKDGQLLNETFTRHFMMSEKAEAKDLKIQRIIAPKSASVVLPPHSVMLVSWQKGEKRSPQYSRIFKAENRTNGVFLKWWKRPEAMSYTLKINDLSNKKTFTEHIEGTNVDSFLFKKAVKGKAYSFLILAKNKAGSSPESSVIELTYAVPTAPKIFKIAPRDNQLTVFWRSVPNANGYKVTVQAHDNLFKKEYDTDNVFGYKIYDLPLNQPLFVSVVAYNGLGESPHSMAAETVCKNNLPLPPSNISAIENAEGAIQLKWNAPKQKNTEGVLYQVFRGEKPHQFSLLKDNLTETAFTDATAKRGKDYFYTVKSYNQNGFCSFYPNVATIIRNNKTLSVWVESIGQNGEGGLNVKVGFRNLPTDGDGEFSVLLSDVSYLNGEETVFKTTQASGNFYTIQIPKSALKPKATYSFKASIRTNSGTPLVSLPPHKEFKIQ